MNFKLFRKAITAGIAAGATAAGGTGAAFVVLPATVHASPTLALLLPMANFLVGFLVGFWPTYFVPNHPPAADAAATTKE